MATTAPTDQISKNTVNPGDMILYVLNAKPEFSDFTKENAWKNFCVLIDRLIIVMGGSMCTHAALAGQAPDTVVEATLPFCRYRQGIYVDEYHVIVRRVTAEGKGAKVLDYVPSGIDPDAQKDSDNLPYAYAQSAVAALLCLFRRETAKLDPLKRDAMLVLLQLILHPLAKEIDDFIANLQGKEGEWFCSQLVTYCYDQAAKTDPAYKLHFPGIDAAKETLIDWLLAQIPEGSLEALSAPGAKTERPALEIAGPEIAHAGIRLLSFLEADAEDVRALFTGALNAGEFLALGEAAPAFAEATVLAKDPGKAASRILADAYKLLSVMRLADPAKSVRDTFNEYKESLVMPSDLENETALHEVGILYDHS